MDQNDLSISNFDEKILIEEAKIYKKDQYFKLILIILAAIFSVLLSMIFYKVAGNHPKQKTVTETTIYDISQDQKNITNYPDFVSFIEKKDIWIYDISSQTKFKITFDGGKEFVYSNLFFSDADSLFFSRCALSTCEIMKYSINQKQFFVTAKIDSSNILDFSWSHDKSMLAVIYQNNTGNYVVEIRKGSQIIDDLGEFPFFATEDDYNKNYSITFSQSDEFLLIQSSVPSKNNFWLKCINIKENYFREWKTTNLNEANLFAVFTENEDLLYKRNMNIYRYNLKENIETKIEGITFTGFNLHEHRGVNKIFYWTYDYNSGISTIWSFDTLQNKIARYFDQKMQPVVVNNKFIAAIETSDCQKCFKTTLPKKSVQLINFETKEVIKIADTVDLQLIAGFK